MTGTKRLLSPLVLVLALTLNSCTIAKPVVCALTTPVLFLSSSPCLPYGCHCRNAEGLAWGFAAVAAVGVVGGLISGFVSDMNLILGHVDRGDACRNLHNPFRTNASADG